MTSHKRFLVTLGMLIFAAIAVGLVYERSVTTVQAASPTVAVVTMRCSNFGGSYGGVQFVASSDPSVTLPANNTSCATALIVLHDQGFNITEAFMPSDSVFEHVLVRQ